MSARPDARVGLDSGRRSFNPPLAGPPAPQWISRTKIALIRCRLTRRACASACSAARSIRRMKAMPCLAGRVAAAGARSALVARHARQSAEGHARLPSLAAHRGGADIARSAHRRHRARGGDRRAIHGRHAEFLHARCPGVRFVWIMGADNLLQFHRWRRLGGDRAHDADRRRSTGRARRMRAASAKAAQRFPQRAADRRATRGCSPITPPPAYRLSARAAQRRFVYRAAPRD